MSEENNKKSHQIRVSEKVLDEIKKRAQAMVDTPDSVLRRVFNLPPKEKPIKK